jgi:hypothetical protein
MDIRMMGFYDMDNRSLNDNERGVDKDDLIYTGIYNEMISTMN